MGLGGGSCSTAYGKKKKKRGKLGNRETDKEIVQMTALQTMWQFLKVKAWQINVNSEVWKQVGLPGKRYPSVI